MYDRVVRNIHLGLFHLKMGRGEDGTFLYRGFSKMSFLGIGGVSTMALGLKNGIFLYRGVSKMPFCCIGGSRK